MQSLVLLVRQKGQSSLNTPRPNGMECLLLNKKSDRSSSGMTRLALSVDDNAMINRLCIISLLLLTVNQFCGTSALAASLLKAVNRSDEPTHVQIFLHFDRLPGFQLNTNGRRVDLELAETVPVESLADPPADGRMLKMVRKEHDGSTILSFYFRYPPQKVTAERNADTAVLLIDVLLGNQLSTAYPELTTKLQGVTVLKRHGNDSLNPVNITPFAKKWPAFFVDYEAPLTLKPPPVLHLPPFPLAAALAPQMPETAWLTEEIQAQARDNKWTQVNQLLRVHIMSPGEETVKERLVLAFAEALIRSGEYREPYFLLQRITIQYPDSQMADLANFLLIYQQAERGDHINAYYEILGLAKKIGQESPLAAAFKLLLAELALTAGRTEEAERLLADPVLNADQALAQFRLLRQADLLVAKKEQAKALTAYLNLAKPPSPVDTDPLSLANFANLLYSEKRYPEAAKRYQTLADLLNNRPDQDLALFRLALCQLRNPATEKKARIDLQQIANAFADRQGGVRAHLRQTDLDYAARRIKAEAAAAIYGKYAVSADAIDLREEAAFKLALVNHLAGNHEASVTQCIELLRGFQSGALRTETLALLIQQLPGVIGQLVKEGEYVKALVLAKRNRMLFARGWLAADLLYDLARAYGKLGMSEQTAQTYQYLFEISTDAGREKIYLPLLQSLFDTGRYVQVEEYADRYQLRYPKGADLPAIFALKVRALYASGQADKALKLLTAENSPRMREMELLKGRIYFENRQWQQAIDTLSQPGTREVLAAAALLLPLAESHFQIGNDAQAAALFQQLARQPAGGEQARFRLAQIAARKGETQEALNLFKELAEKGTDPLWSKLAREETAILELGQRTTTR